MGYDIEINPKHKGKFKKYCKKVTGSDEVTDACIEKGLASDNPIIRKEANFSKNSKQWNHK